MKGGQKNVTTKICKQFHELFFIALLNKGISYLIREISCPVLFMRKLFILYYFVMCFNRES